MRVGPRITATTSIIVAVTLGIYALFNLRSNAADRREQVEREGRSLALQLRATLEARGLGELLRDPESVEELVNGSGTKWRAHVVTAREALPGARAQGIDEERASRLRKLIAVRTKDLASSDVVTYRIMVPLRVPSIDSADGFRIVGGLELERSIGFLRDAAEADAYQTALILLFTVGVLIAAIVASTRFLVTRPIEKLLAGIDDVAQGDLSRVLLSERDDEIGELAMRFNEMTFSLRESQAETARHNDARLSLEQRLFHTEKLATMGQLAAEIAHEVGTPLNVIAGRARSLSKKADRQEAVARNANIIAEQAGRITRIIQRLLDFTRQKVGVVEDAQVNVNEIALTTLEFLESQITSAHVKSKLVRTEGLPPVEGNADRLQQVLLNLFINAIQAMPDGGELEVETAVEERKRPGLEAAPAQDYVRLDVSDSGPGISPELRERIFDPFYTSKDGQGGTGLGLAVCQGIIKEHDGWIEVSDRDGGGTVFRVYLPAFAPADRDDEVGRAA